MEFKANQAALSAGVYLFMQHELQLFLGVLLDEQTASDVDHDLVGAAA